MAVKTDQVPPGDLEARVQNTALNVVPHRKGREYRMASRMHVSEKHRGLTIMFIVTLNVYAEARSWARIYHLLD